MSDDIGARLGIIHRAGCKTPTLIAAWPLATVTGRNPAIEVVADGKGGELFRCRLCGMVEGQRPDTALSTPAASVSVRQNVEPIEAEQDAPQEAPDDATAPGRLAWAKIEAEYKKLALSDPLPKYRRRRKDLPSRPETANALNTSARTLTRACDWHGKGTRWPPAGL